MTESAPGLDRVAWNTNCRALIGHRAGDRLANPLRGIRAELEPAAIFELVDGPHQTGVAFLNQVQERQPAVAVLLCDRHDQTQVAFRQPALGPLIFAIDLLQVLDAISQARWRLLKCPQNIAILDEQRPTL